MNLDALAALAQFASAWADAYAAVYEELVRRGTPEDEARTEARWAAHAAAYWTEPEEKEAWEE